MTDLAPTGFSFSGVRIQHLNFFEVHQTTPAEQNPVQFGSLLFPFSFLMAIDEVNRLGFGLAGVLHTLKKEKKIA